MVLAFVAAVHAPRSGSIFTRSCPTHSSRSHFFFYCVLCLFFSRWVSNFIWMGVTVTAATKSNPRFSSPSSSSSPHCCSAVEQEAPLASTLHVAPQIQPRIPFIQDRKQLCTHVQSFLDENMKTAFGMFDKWLFASLQFKRMQHQSSVINSLVKRV